MKRFQCYSAQKSFMVGGWWWHCNYSYKLQVKVSQRFEIDLDIETFRVHMELTWTQPGPELDNIQNILLSGELVPPPPKNILFLADLQCENCPSSSVFKCHQASSSVIKHHQLSSSIIKCHNLQQCNSNSKKSKKRYYIQNLNYFL